MKGLSLALCDADEVYCQRLYEYLKNNLNLSFNIFSFTGIEDLKNFARKEAVSLLIISESLHYELVDRCAEGGFKNVLVLDEETSWGGMLCEPAIDTGINIRHVSKYQSAAGVVNELIEFCTDSPDSFTGLRTQAKLANSRILGFFSPLSKCGQTTMAINSAEKLAEHGKVIFLSFESFSSLPDMLGIVSEQNITDLAYYAECEKNKFGLYLEKIKRTVNGVDYIMPAKTAAQIKDIGSEKIKELLGLLSGDAGYDYVVMDLTEYPDGFFDILAMCNKIFTVTGNNVPDSARISQYETILRENGLSEIESRTVKIQVPDYRDRHSCEKYIEELLEREGLTDGNKT
jgi:hypothetical protein